MQGRNKRRMKSRHVTESRMQKGILLTKIYPVIKCVSCSSFNGDERHFKLIISWTSERTEGIIWSYCRYLNHDTLQQQSQPEERASCRSHYQITEFNMELQPQ